MYCLTEQTIGQAYEEMQTQNSRLIHQITERDDYNTQVFLVAIVHLSFLGAITILRYEF